jgi:hypothetical protein
MNAVQTALSSARFNRLILGLGVLVLAAGALTLVLTVAGGTDKTSVSPDAGFRPQLPTKSTPLKNADGTTVKKYEQLDPQVRSAIKTFIASAVARNHLEDSWDVVAPSMRAGYTFAEWKAAKELPIVPYPVADINKVEYYLDYASTKEILVEVGLSAKQSVGIRPTTFLLALVPVRDGSSARWMVNYWMPRWTPPVPSGN